MLLAAQRLDGSVIGRSKQQHRHGGFIRLLNDVERAVPKPIVWTASAASILAKLDSLPAPSV
jgi:hypothetical protein